MLDCRLKKKVNRVNGLNLIDILRYSLRLLPFVYSLHADFCFMFVLCLVSFRRFSLSELQQGKHSNLKLFQFNVSSINRFSF